MNVVAKVKSATAKAINTLYKTSLTDQDILVNATKPEFEGDYTVVLFSLIKQLKKSPEILGKEIGIYLVENNVDLFSGFNLIKGFLNLSVAHGYWAHFLHHQFTNTQFGLLPATAGKVMIEYSSPNTNKPLHLGHLRNNFLGWSMAEILKANGHEVVKTCIANDRGIHICKSMVAWQMFANGATPESAGLKGDHFVGDYYVMFGEVMKKQVAELVEGGLTKEQAEKEAPIMKAAQQMLVQWEAGDVEVSIQEPP
jgi:arginyl-tRNA synthetase